MSVVPLFGPVGPPTAFAATVAKSMKNRVSAAVGFRPSSRSSMSAKSEGCEPGALTRRQPLLGWRRYSGVPLATPVSAASGRQRKVASVTSRQAAQAGTPRGGTRSVPLGPLDPLLPLTVSIRARIASARMKSSPTSARSARTLATCAGSTPCACSSDASMLCRVRSGTLSVRMPSS